MKTGTTVTLTTLICALATAASAQQVDRSERKPRAVVRPSLPFELDEHCMEPDQVLVKFREGLRVRLTAGQLTATTVAADSQELRPFDLSRVLALLEGTSCERLFSRSVVDLDGERARLQPLLPIDEDPLADLNNYYRLRTSGSAATERLVNRLNGLPEIETAYPEYRYVGTLAPDIPPPTPDYRAEQDYLGAAPLGVSFHAVHSVVGARSPDHQMGHMEGSWIFGHEDCAHLVPANLLGQAPTAPWNTTQWRNHGAACVGIMAADRNGYGMVGMGSATPRVLLSSMSNGSANMISLLTAALQPGDVMSSSVAPFTMVRGVPIQHPLDFLQAEFDAIRVASTNQIFCTLAAANGGLELENTFIYGARYLASSASSGAFIIGATDGSQLVKAAWSNWGQRVDANCWGFEVATLGFGDLAFLNNDYRQTYTDTFGGTSAAAPIVAGVIATLVGTVQEQLGRTLTLGEVRQALRATGTPVPGPQPIGTRPDLLQLLANFGLPDGMLTTRDGQIGSWFELEIRGNPSESFGTMLSAGRGRLPIPANRPLLLDPTMMLPLRTGTLPPSGTLRVLLPVPNDPALHRLGFYLQTLIVRGANLHLTNSVELWID